MLHARSVVTGSRALAVGAGLIIAFHAVAAPAEPPPPPKTGEYNNAGLANRAAGNENLIVLIHGWRDDPSMWTDFKAELEKDGVLPAKWQIWEYDWRQDADRANFLTAVENTPAHMDNLAHQIITKGKIDGAGQWKHVQFISHSLGAMPNEGANRRIRKAGVPSTQQTFLDPACNDQFIPLFGAETELGENYFSTGKIPATGRKFTKMSNVELYPMSPYSAVTSPALNHKWPVEWYKEGIAGTDRVPKSTYDENGWGFSLEKAQKVSKAWPAAGYAGLKNKLQTMKANGTVDKTEALAAAIEENRTPTMTAVAQSPGGVTITSAVAARSTVTGIDFDASGSDLSWVTFDLDTTNAGGLVSGIEFSYAFTSLSTRLGSLAAFIADPDGTWREIFHAEEGNNLLGTALQFHEPSLFWYDLGPGVHSLAFSFAALDGLPTEAIVRDIEFVYLAPAPGAAIVMMLGMGVAARRRRVVTV